MAGQLGFGATIAGSTTTSLGTVTKIDLPTVAADNIDITSLSSTDKYSEKSGGKIDAGECSVTALYESTATTVPLYGSLGLAAETWTVTYDDTGTLVFSGFISNIEAGELTEDGQIEISYTITLTSLPVYAP